MVFLFERLFVSLQRRSINIQGLIRIKMELSINNLATINATAREFITCIRNSRVLAFYGKMGAGKTTFIKALCEELGVNDVITSPTFAIVNEYTAGDGAGKAIGIMPNDAVYHFDFYRIKKLDEVYDMGYEDYFYSGSLCMIEWPELIEELLPEDALCVNISEEEDGTRKISF